MNSRVPGLSSAPAPQETSGSRAELRVLMVEDLRTDAELLAHELKRAEIVYSIRRVESERDFVRELEGFGADVILSDYSLPLFSGRAALAIARELRPEIPFIFVSGTLGEETAIEALKNGATDYVLKSNLRRVGPSVKRAVTEARERAARRRAELMREEQNRILERIAAGAPLAELLDELILTMERQFPGMLCSVLLLDEDGVHLRTGAAPSLPQAYRQAIDGVAIGPAAGSCGTAAHRKEQVIVTDIATDPLWADYRDLAAAHGLRACWSTPILSGGGDVFGTFAIYFRAPHRPGADELALIESTIHIVRIAIERHRADAEILRANERLGLALEASDIALWDTDVARERIYLTENWSRMLHEEVARETVTTVRELLRIAHPDERDTFRALAKEITLGLRPGYEIEYRVMTKTGAWKWILSRGKVVEKAADGKASRIIGTNVDITTRKLSEEQAARISRVHALMGRANAAVMRIRERQPLLEEICRSAVAVGEFGAAWIALAGPDAEALKAIACAGRNAEALAAALCARTDDAAEPGPLARLLRERDPCFCGDLGADHAWARLRPELQALGCRSLAALPLMTAGQPAGVLVLHGEKPAEFSQDERLLLGTFAGDVSFAFDAIAKDEKLHYLANYDLLTGLPNRALFLEHLGHVVATAKRSERIGAVALIDVDRFRLVNDSLGRQAGDSLLGQIAERLKQGVFERDTLARIGPDNFAVLFREVRDAEELGHMLEDKLLASLVPAFSLGKEEVRVSVRIGIAMFPGDGAHADALLANAQAALRRARGSPEHYAFYAPKMNARVAERLTLETELRRSIEAEQFVLHYQPKVDLKSGRMAGVEALIRWQHPRKGLIPPYQFIPILEETGMILAVGSWVLAKAAADHAAWTAQGFACPRIAVNVSAAQLRRKGFSDEIAKAIGEAGAAEGLELEITESLMMHDIEANIEKLKAVRDLGLKIAIDDFGTGYSSLSYLSKLPVNTLKIDQAFIVGMPQNPDDMTIVSAVIALAHSLRFNVVAEGVETDEQLKLLKLLRCDQMQGYLYSRPLPLEHVQAMFARPVPEAALPREGNG